VAWIDPFATGETLGRGVLTVGDHAALTALPPKLRSNPLKRSGPPKITVPFELPEITLNSLSVRLVNAYIERKLSHEAPFVHYEDFFYPLDSFGHWYRGYGPRGFTQYQFVIPYEDCRENLQKLLTTIATSGQLPFLNILKTLGPASGGMLSFPMEGYTFAIDFPVRTGLDDLLARLDQMVLDAGGRIYLGKDAYLHADTFRAMYPQAREFLELKARLDPGNVFTSNLARRVGLIPQ
jgi:decaprenylphospho-beta-D-ribofuranose 2-oxidase